MSRTCARARAARVTPAFARRGTTAEQNSGMRTLGMRNVLRGLTETTAAKALADRGVKLWVLEAWNFSGSAKPLCAELGIGHVNVNGHIQGTWRKGTYEDRMAPDVYRDLALVFTEDDDPWGHLIGAALDKLGPEYTREGLLLVTTANRCTTYCPLRAVNGAQDNWITRTGTGEPLPLPRGLMAVIDDAVNEYMFAHTVALPRAPVAPPAAAPKRRPPPAAGPSGASASTEAGRSKSRRVEYTVSTRQLTCAARDAEADKARALEQARRERVQQWVRTHPAAAALLGEWRDVNPPRCPYGVYSVELGTVEEAVDVHDGELVVKVFCGGAKPPKVRSDHAAHVRC